MSFPKSVKIQSAPNFGIVHPFLDHGSKLTDEVMVDDISTRVLSDLLAIDMKLFDAVIWLRAKDQSGHPLRADPTMKPDDIPSNNHVAQSVFYASKSSE
ncbi:hypothetical protein E4U59_001043 [Claviceps monticola]|nr:hypothetical protein E4U59_001043 [Claviceps monticola]